MSDFIVDLWSCSASSVGTGWVFGRQLTESNGKAVEMVDCCYDVPLHESLQTLLRMDIVRDQVSIHASCMYIYIVPCLLLPTCTSLSLYQLENCFWMHIERWWTLTLYVMDCWVTTVTELYVFTASLVPWGSMCSTDPALFWWIGALQPFRV